MIPATWKTEIECSTCGGPAHLCEHDKWDQPSTLFKPRDTAERRVLAHLDDDDARDAAIFAQHMRPMRRAR